MRLAYMDSMAQVAENNVLNSILSQIAQEPVFIEPQNACIGEAIRAGEYAIS